MQIKVYQAGYYDTGNSDKELIKNNVHCHFNFSGIITRDVGMKVGGGCWKSCQKVTSVRGGGNYSVPASI